MEMFPVRDRYLSLIQRVPEDPIPAKVGSLAKKGVLDFTRPCCKITLKVL